MSSSEHNPKPDQEDDERRFKVAKEVAEQIWREQQLTNSRMTWNLTFQSFMLTAFTVTFGQNNDPTLALLLRASVCIAGIAVAWLTREAVLASQRQRDFLKGIWHSLHPDPDLHAYPRPFAESRESARGRLAPAKFFSS